MNVTAVLGEFESHPNINVDDEFVRERSQTLSAITLQLENLSRKEATLDQELKNQSDWRNRLKQINKEYATLAGTIRGQRNREIRRLNGIINRLKKDQDSVIRMKTGFFHGISKKDREQKEMTIAQELNNRQTELELVMLDFNAKQKELQAEYRQKKRACDGANKKISQNNSKLRDGWFLGRALVCLRNPHRCSEHVSAKKSNPVLRGVRPKNLLSLNDTKTTPCVWLCSFHRISWADVFHFRTVNSILPHPSRLAISFKKSNIFFPIPCSLYSSRTKISSTKRVGKARKLE